MINRNSRLTKHLVKSGFFRNRHLVVLDVGARGGFEPFWAELYDDQVEFIGLEPDRQECESLNLRLAENMKIYPVALHKDKKARSFYRTAFADSSSFYQPNDAVVNRFLDHISLKVIDAEEMETQDMDSFAAEHEIERIDFVKLDVEGAELDVLEGAENLLAGTILGLRLEVLFTKMRNGQPLFSEIEMFLRERGFALFDLSPHHRSRKALPDRLIPTFHSDYGQIMWAEALFLRDAVAELRGKSNHARDWDRLDIVTLASMMDVFGMNDCSIELLQTAAQEQILPRDRTDGLVDLLIPQIEGVSSYRDYFQHLILKELQGFLLSVLETRPELTPAVQRAVECYNRGDTTLAMQIMRDEFVPLSEPREGVAPHICGMQKFFYETFCENLREQACAEE
ncbi:MAG: FkbM family methyltransferase [Planctomycetota bacterium]|jgi:FkbM family methyltransferase